MRVFQFTLFCLLVLVSSAFTLNLALGLGVTPVERGALVAGSLAIEALKAYALIAGNGALGRRAYGSALVRYAAYGLFALYSVSACLGYALTTVDRMESATVVVGHETEIQAEQAALVDCDAQIATLRQVIAQRQAALVGLKSDRAAQVRKGIVETLSRVDGYQDRKDAAVSRLSAWKGQDQQARASHRRTLYQVIGSALGISAGRVAFALLAIFAAAIELGIILTSPHAGSQPQGHLSEQDAPALADTSTDPECDPGEDLLTWHRQQLNRLLGRPSTPNPPRNATVAHQAVAHQALARQPCEDSAPRHSQTPRINAALPQRS